MTTERIKVKLDEIVIDKSVSAKDVFNLLLAASIEQVFIVYDGSGDSGQIEDIYVKYKNSAADEHMDLNTTNLKPLYERLQNYGYELLEQFCPGDWVNNEGGFGKIKINLGHEMQFVLEFNQREMNIDYSETLITEKEAFEKLRT